MTAELLRLRIADDPRVVKQLRGRGPGGGFFDEGFRNKIAEIWRKHSGGWGGGRVIDDECENLKKADGFCAVWEGTYSALEDGQAKAPNVGRVGVLLPLQALGRHVRHRAHKRGGAFLRRVAHAKVRDLDLALRVDQNVVGLDVAMHDAQQVVQVLQAAQDLLAYPHEHCLGDGPALATSLPSDPTTVTVARAIEGDDGGVGGAVQGAQLKQNVGA
eukprot:CAMPEP_0177671410 /NCGR_PEP_ID=MMETSP0447-20121125/24687_1 /TAXON_ID=0 /ORGANISM="Stygamoeba regulata, Strain BSH-02190019" /LENGTH=215 /DNA_ID=CAMNT_0019178797 /DNA_START=154 /DNA_END=803 /DNA_ORIENTATION=+